jgi:hypothetical protein
LLLLLVLLLPLLSLLLVLQGQLPLFVNLSECLNDIRLCPPGGGGLGCAHVGGACIGEGVLIRILGIMVFSAFVTLTLLLMLLLLLQQMLLLLLLLLMPELLHLLLLLLR